MNKILLVIVAVAAIGAGGWFGFQRYQMTQAKRAEKTRAVAVQAQQAAAAAKQRAAQAADALARKEVESQLKPMKVSSIMPGQPGIVIIDKKEYAEGDHLTLPHGGKSLQIARVRDDGVLLAYNGQTFHLDPPAAPDLDAIRRK